MKKTILGNVAVLAIATMVALNIQLNITADNERLDVSLTDVEALAQESSLSFDWWITPDGLYAETFSLENKQVETSTTETTGQTSGSWSVTFGLPEIITITWNQGNTSTSTATTYTTVPCCVKKDGVCNFAESKC